MGWLDFIGYFSTIAAPLNELVKKGVDFKWGIDQTKAFETLKQKLINAPLLALSNFVNVRPEKIK